MKSFWQVRHIRQREVSGGEDEAANGVVVMAKIGAFKVYFVARRTRGYVVMVGVGCKDGSRNNRRATKGFLVD